MPMLKKRQRVVEAGDEGRTAAALCYSLAASSLHSQGQLPLHDLLSKICDTTNNTASPYIPEWYITKMGPEPIDR